MPRSTQQCTLELLQQFGLTEADLEMNRHGRLSDLQFDERIAFPQMVHRLFAWFARTCGGLLFIFFLWGLFRGWRSLESVGFLVIPLVACLSLSIHYSRKAKHRFESERSDRASVQSFDAKVNITRTSYPGQRSGLKVTTERGRIVKAGAALPLLQTGILYRFYEYKGEVVSVEILKEPGAKQIS